MSKHDEAVTYLTNRIEAMDAGNERESDFFRSLKGGLDKFGKLTDGQVEALIRSAERDEQRAAESAQLNDVPAMKGVLTGKILSTKWKDTPYGLRFTMTLMDDRGFKVWGSVPKAIADTVEDLSADILTGHGPMITFTATVEPSKGDPKFGFFSRPSGGQILAQRSY